MKTETVYSDNGNYVIAQKDARGNSVVNLLDSNGRTVSVTDPAGNSVFYAYDASNRVVGVTSEASGKVYKNSYTYENDRIKTIAHNTTSDTVNDVTYTFEYDDLGRKTAVKVGNQELSRNVYSNDRKGLLDEMNFGNGAKVRYEYDDFGRTTAIYVDEPGETSTTPKYEFKYDARGIASVIKDNVLMTETRVTSDLADRPSESVTRDANGNLVHKSMLNYDSKNRVKEFVDILPYETHKTAYTYDADNRVTEVKYDNSDTHKVNYSYDLLNRITTKTVTNGVPYSTTYGYLAGDTTGYGANATTPLVANITQGEGANAMNFAYSYDNRGNIVSEVRNGVTVSYEYDELGQLIRVNDPNDKTAGTSGTTWVYTYDRGGNILNKSAYGYTTSAVSSPVNQWSYAYEDTNWKDKLTKFNGATITYDAIGNPLSDGTWTYVWEKGRQLKSMHNASTGVTMEFKYNQNGIRTQKIKKVNGVIEDTTNYTLSGNKIVSMYDKDDMLSFTYDASGAPATVTYIGGVYTYVKNLQGDIVGILDVAGNLVVEYKYDAWGNQTYISGILHTLLGKVNPFRYRGYAYDEETGLYYLRSRYYNSSKLRFLNSDAIMTNTGTLSKNLFTYTRSNPILYKDSSGFFDTINVALDFNKNCFSQFLNYDTERKQIIMASGSFEGIPFIVDENFEKISGKNFTVPNIYIDNEKPISIEFVNYIQYKNLDNVTLATIREGLQFVSAGNMGDIIDYAAMWAGIPINGEIVSRTAEFIDEVAGDYLGDYHVLNVHVVSMKYNYWKAGSMNVTYTFYESSGCCYSHYDGVHAQLDLKDIYYNYRGKFQYKP